MAGVYRWYQYKAEDKSDGPSSLEPRATSMMGSRGLAMSRSLRTGHGSAPLDVTSVTSPKELSGLALAWTSSLGHCYPQ